jgi:hypothetical protein
MSSGTEPSVSQGALGEAQSSDLTIRILAKRNRPIIEARDRWGAWSNLKRAISFREHEAPEGIARSLRALLVALDGVARVDVIEMIDRRDPLLPLTKAVINHLLAGGAIERAAELIRDSQHHPAFSEIRQELIARLPSLIAAELKIDEQLESAAWDTQDAVLPATAPAEARPSSAESELQVAPIKRDTDTRQEAAVGHDRGRRLKTKRRIGLRSTRLPPSRDAPSARSRSTLPRRSCRGQTYLAGRAARVPGSGFACGPRWNRSSVERFHGVSPAIASCRRTESGRRRVTER